MYQIASLAADLPDTGRLAEEIEASFWDRKTGEAGRNEDRDSALLSQPQIAGYGNGSETAARRGLSRR